MSERLTLATSTGLPLLALAFHVATGVVALTAGSIAIGARKGGTLHRRAGLVFVVSMIAMGFAAVGISFYEGKESVTGGALTAYLVFTAWTTLRPLPRARRQIETLLMVFAFTMAALGYVHGYNALSRPGNRIEGIPAGMVFFMTTIILLAAIGDARMIRAGGIQGSRRLARHLWRMCYGLFIATGSFVAQLVRMSFMPEWTRSVPVILVLAAGPLVVLSYWMWRVRLRQNLRGLLLTRPMEARRPA